jgi:beta-galactosidase
MEAYDQGSGCILYRTTIPAGPETPLDVGIVHDFGWAFLDGRPVGIMDRRWQSAKAILPARAKPQTLDILVEAMGRVNFGQGVHDRKGLKGPVSITGASGAKMQLENWQIFNLPLDGKELSALRWKPGPAQAPAFWRGTFNADKTADTFFDVSSWGKGVLWINGHCLGRFWNIGPTQTMYVPGPWLKKGRNEVIVLDLVGPEKPVISGLEKPILDALRPDRDWVQASKLTKGKILLDGKEPVWKGTFANKDEGQVVEFGKVIEGRQICLEMLSSQDGGPFAVISELDLLDESSRSISHAPWNIIYVDSEEQGAEDGSAANSINGQISDFWHTTWSSSKPPYPHRLVIDLGANTKISGLRYTPRAGMKEVGRIKDYQIYLGDKLVEQQP